MKTYFIDFAAHRGGAEISLEILLRHIRRAHTRLILPQHAAMLPVVHVHTVNIPVKQLIQNKKGIRAGIVFAGIFSKGMRSGLDNSIIVSNTFKAHVYAMAAKLACSGCRWIIAERDMPENNLMRFIRDIMHFIADKTVFNSNTLKRAYRECGSTVIYNPVERGTVTGDADMNRFVFAGTLSYQKGIDRFLEVFRSVKRKFPDAHAELFGNQPPYEGGIRVEPEHDVKLRGFACHSDIYSGGGYIMLFPRVKESFSRVTAEAMSYGMIPVTLKGGGTDDYLNESNAVLSDGFEPDEIAERIADVKNGREQSLSINAAKSAHLFDPAVIANQWEDILDEIIA